MRIRGDESQRELLGRSRGLVCSSRLNEKQRTKEERGVGGGYKHVLYFFLVFGLADVVT